MVTAVKWVEKFVPPADNLVSNVVTVPARAPLGLVKQLTLPPARRIWNGSAWDPAPVAVAAPTWRNHYRPVFTTIMSDTFDRVAANLGGSTPNVGGNWNNESNTRWVLDGSGKAASSGNSGVQRWYMPRFRDTILTLTGVEFDTAMYTNHYKQFTAYIKGVGSTDGMWVYVYEDTQNNGGAISWALVCRQSNNTYVNKLGPSLGFSPNTGVKTFDMEISIVDTTLSATVNGLTMSAAVPSAIAVTLRDYAFSDQTGIECNDYAALAGHVKIGSIQVQESGSLISEVGNATNLVLPDPIRRWDGDDWETLYEPGIVKRSEVITPGGIVPGPQVFATLGHPHLYSVPADAAPVSGHPHLYSTP